MKAEIQLSWKGKTYIIPENEAFEVGEAIEDVITLSALQQMARDPKFHKLARAYAVMLNHVGVRATREDVHKEMMDEIKAIAKAGGVGTGKAKQLVAANAVAALLAILMDGAPDAEEGDEGNSQAASSNGPSNTE